MVSIFLGKPCDRVSKEIMWWVLEKETNSYIDVIKDMNDEATTNMRTFSWRGDKAFPNYYQ